MRLNKFLAGAGVASRRKSDELIKNGEITVNDIIISELGTEISPKKDIIAYKGKVISLPKSFIYLKMNKPKGYICSSKDDKGRKIVLDLINEKDYRLFTIGRLDYDTEGLILLTNDGNFANSVMHPKNNINKTYIVNIEGDIFESEMAVMRAGVVLDDTTRMPSCKVVKKGFKDGVSRLEISIDEGQNRQIRRMFEALGRSIIMLKRVAIGKVKLGGLSRGEYKDMTPEEIFSLVNPKLLKQDK